MGVSTSNIYGGHGMDEETAEFHGLSKLAFVEIFWRGAALLSPGVQVPVEKIGETVEHFKQRRVDRIKVYVARAELVREFTLPDKTESRVWRDMLETHFLEEDGSWSVSLSNTLEDTCGPAIKAEELAEQFETKARKQAAPLPPEN